MSSDALLVLDDGTVFQGISIGCKGYTLGELVFNTSHVGYQEALTDPSYASQLLVFTSPHIGNVGYNLEDIESNRFWAAGLVLREKPTAASHWMSQGSFQSYLEKNHVIGIAEIDTRQLTRRLRDSGNSIGCITSGELDIHSARNLALAFRENHSADLLKKVSTPVQYSWNQVVSSSLPDKNAPHIVILDYGVKHNILRQLAALGYNVTVMPATTSAEEVNSLQADGIVLSNGPGDPAIFKSQIEVIKSLFNLNIPMLGICLGHQLLGLASGAKISKLKFGHHGINHPIKDLKTGAVFISSQNHNFVIDDMTLSNDWMISHQSLFDGSIQGIQHKSKSIWGVQGHPEGSPGPILNGLIDPFCRAVVLHSQRNRLGSITCQETLI